MNHVNFDPNSIDWHRFFAQQQSGGYFEGIPFQRGAGVGSIFKSLYRFLMPVGRELAKEGVSFGAKFLDNISHGQTPKESLVKESRHSLKNILNKASDRLSQSGSGIKRRRKRQPAVSFIGNQFTERSTTPKRAPKRRRAPSKTASKRTKFDAVGFL